ncbi:MAG TPA: Ig-like domain-containing protein, partial [Candidatus Thermoplasmatota archaeon]|nr:Ig-like domain-containing protein [Candidatus Thermoplasmatota archaeon]
INAPVSGDAEIITPEVTVENHGWYDIDNVPVNMKITKNQCTDYFNQHFDGVFPPAGWSNLATTDFWVQSYTSYAGGTSPEAILSSYNNQGATAGFQSAYVDTSSSTELELSFRSYIDWGGGPCNCTVEATGDGGTTWNDVSPWTNPITVSLWPWLYTINISAYIGTQTGIRFMYFGLNTWMNVWAIDDVWLGWRNRVPEYNQTMYVDIPAWVTMDVSLPDWTPSDLGVDEDVNLSYIVRAATQFPGNYFPFDFKQETITLHFGYIYDVAVNQIVSPVDGLAETQIPEVVIENIGQLDQNVNVTMVISKIQYGAQWTQESDTEWTQTFTNVAGGVSPEAWLPYYNIVGDYAYLMSYPIDTSAESSISLSFRSMINDYAGGYNCYIKTRSSESDPWTDVSPWTNPIYGSLSAAQYTIDISGDIGTDTQVMFEFSGYYWNLNYWYIDDFSVGAYSTDFSGDFPPVEINLIDEYDETTTVDIAPGETLNVSLPEWTPADVPFATTVNYLINATVSMNVTDENPADNELVKMITLYYEHDVGVIEITQPHWLYYLWDYPIEGIVQNFGVTYSELDIPVNAQFEIDDVVIYDETVIVQGPLFPGATTTVIFPNITIPRTLPKTVFKLTMQTQLANDDHSENNKKIKTWYIPPPPDDIPPVTNATVSGNVGQNDWYVTNVQVTLIAVDFGGELPMGVNNTYYSINDPDPTTWELYTTPIVVDDHCFHGTVYFYSDDKKIPPNVEEVKNVSFKIDQDPPIFTDYTFTPVNFMKDEWLCKATGVDSCSGIVLVEFYVDGTLIGNVTGEPYEFEFDGKPTNNSQALAYDAAGNSALSPIAQYYEMNYQTWQSHQILGAENKNEI